MKFKSRLLLHLMVIATSENVSLQMEGIEVAYSNESMFHLNRGQAFWDLTNISFKEQIRVLTLFSNWLWQLKWFLNFYCLFSDIHLRKVLKYCICLDKVLSINSNFLCFLFSYIIYFIFFKFSNIIIWFSSLVFSYCLIVMLIII